MEAVILYWGNIGIILVLGFRVWRSGFRVWGLGFRVCGLRFRVSLN